MWYITHMKKDTNSRIMCPMCRSFRTFPDWEGGYRCSKCEETFSLKQSVKALAKKKKKSTEKKDARKDRRNAARFLGRKAKEMRRCPTGAEAVFARRLDEAGVKYKTQWTFNVNGILGICDFFLPDLDTIIEVDGGYHLGEEQKLKDLEKDFICTSILKKKMIRLTNNQAMFSPLNKYIATEKD